MAGQDRIPGRGDLAARLRGEPGVVVHYPGAGGCITPVGVQMEQHTSQPTNRKAKEESNAVPLCRARPSPSFTNLQASSPPDTFLNVQATKLHSGVDHKPKGCLGLLEGMYTNLLLQTQLAKQQMAILENLQASVTRLAPGRESKKPPGPILQPIVKSPAPVQ
uniref:TSSK6 activating cochaperone n=1 Tax=Rousettus aegyptiacus TaxID=9407 RepID=A0A7J8BHE5_ROUAE|nr:TSSK6 activating cochaperone [Rousettus aegyptiacus]